MISPTQRTEWRKKARQGFALSAARTLSLLDALDEREADLARSRAQVISAVDSAQPLWSGEVAQLEARAEDAEAELAKALAENTKLGAELNAAYRLAGLSSSADEVQALAEAVKERDDMAKNAADWCDRADAAYGRIDTLSALLRKAGEGARAIADSHLGDQPAALNMPDYDWAVRHIRDLRKLAAALAQEIREALQEPPATDA